MQSLMAVGTTISPLPAASEPAPGTLQRKELVPFACACTGCTGHARPPRSRTRLGPRLAGPAGARRCTERLEPCVSSVPALKEQRATSADRSRSSGRAGRGRRRYEAICGVWRSWVAPESKKDSRAPIGWTSGTRSLLACGHNTDASATGGCFLAYSCLRCKRLGWRLQILLPDPLAEMDLSSIGEASSIRATFPFPKSEEDFSCARPFLFLWP